MPPTPPDDDPVLPDGVQPLEPSDPRELGRHRILGRIGRGGMGLVYLGETPDGRRIAVKVVRPEYAQDPEFRTRFRREADAARRVEGHFVAALVDADLEGTAPWLATEYVPGPTLAAALAANGPMTETEVRSLVAHLAEALREVHRADLVHRDLKPANVLLGPDGPRVIDMGIARSADATSLTMTGMQLGTPMFMAPEQARGDDPEPTTDVWALGAVAYYAATCKRPFGEGRPDIMYYRVVHEEPQLDDCPAWLRPFITACLAKDPADRPSLAEILAAQPGLPGPRADPTPEPAPAPTPAPALSTPDVPSVVPAAEDDSPSADTQLRRTTAPAEPAVEHRPRRGPRRLVLALVAAVVVVGGGTAVALNWPGDDDPAPTAGPTSRETTRTTTPSTEVSDASDAVEAALDPCLVGRWKQTSMTDTWDLLGESVDVTGWDGRVLEVDADGSATYHYDDAAPITGEMSAGTIVDTWSGTSTETLTTSGDTLHYAGADNSAASVDRDFAGVGETYTPPAQPSGDLAYTCDDTTHTQRETGGAYEATFTRLG